MTAQQEIRNKYFDWLYNQVCKGRSHGKVSYKRLFEFLDSIEFIFSIPNDANRAEDGVELRYRFATDEIDFDDFEDAIDAINDRPCSVLEMMVALAMRCEENIMDNTKYGDRTAQWFWNMISNLGIGNMMDDVFDESVVNEIIYDFLYRCYDADGKGGLFYIYGCEYDLREVEIWTQLCWYLDNFA